MTGREPAAIAGEMWFLHSLASATRIRVGPRFGPLADGGIPLEDGLPSMFEERLLRLIDDMALIQREMCADLRIPDLDDIDPETVKSLRIAAALLRGAAVRTAVETMGCNEVIAIRVSAPPAVLPSNDVRSLASVIGRAVLETTYDEVAESDVSPYNG